MKLWRGQPDHEHWRRPPSRKEVASCWLGLGSVCLLLGVVQWLEPSHPPFTGRWSWFTGMAYQAIGLHGPAIVTSVLGLLVLIVGLASWPRK